jgi:hypothetical protein
MVFTNIHVKTVSTNLFRETLKESIKRDINVTLAV